jgi:hypothetical protein
LQNKNYHYEKDIFNHSIYNASVRLFEIISGQTT